MGYFALLFPKDRMGYALYYAPKDRTTIKKEYRTAIIGDFATKEEADALVNRRLKDVKIQQTA